ncbi:uncharacterized protein EI97DRAFT_435528 [Westerdykella ornata]|uniref:Integral membrane protein n=1 Tax=Westerdykella ornata TaxID=318751 RepID=A0A6A6JBB0_WESOR|nr:uncharacterized protein EI97DRAFT_435528 [Westerdykella ornata]KAF2273881.1 hypothetical protein EI97DRAFT_435528 [Westerdykella ornata]
MSAGTNRLFLTTAIAHGLLSLGHTAKGLEQFKEPSLKQIPALLRTTVKVGWYEGSVFFVIAALLNLKWSHSPIGLVDPLDKAIATLLTTLLFGAGAKYYGAGDRGTGITLAIVGILQGLGLKGGL